MQLARYLSPKGIADVWQGTKHYLGKGIGRAAFPLAAATIVTASSFIPISRQGVYNALQDTGSRIVYEMGEAAKGMGNAINPATARAEPTPVLDKKVYVPILYKNYPPQVPAMSGRDYAVSIGLPQEIAEQFSPIAKIDENSFYMINETKDLQKYWDVFKKRTDILAQYISNSAVSEQQLGAFRDLDSDGVSNATELANRTSIFNPCDKDPANPSRVYAISLSGAQVVANPRIQEVEIEAGPLMIYHMFRRLGVPDSDIYLFEQYRFSAVSTLATADITRKLNLTDEDKVRDIINRAGLADSYLSADRIVQGWKNEGWVISDDLLTAFGPVQIDYLNQQVTKANLRKVFAEIRSKVKPTDEIYFLRQNHGGPRHTYSWGQLPPGFNINSFGGEEQGLYPYDINDFLKGISYCRAIDMQNSSYAGATEAEIFLNKDLQPSPVGGPTIGIGTSNPDNSSGNFVLFTLMNLFLKDNPYLSIQKVLDKSYDPYTGKGFDGYTNSNDPNIKSQFFFFPRAR